MVSPRLVKPKNVVNSVHRIPYLVTKFVETEYKPKLKVPRILDLWSSYVF